MELQSDLTSDLETETISDKTKDITNSSTLKTMKRKSIPDTDADSIEPLMNELDKTSEDAEPPEDCTLPSENSAEPMDTLEIPHQVSSENNNQGQCQRHLESDSRDSISNFHSHNSTPDELNSPSSPGSSESLDNSKFEEIINVDLRRTSRNSKRKKENGLCCPVCSLTLRVPELESHYNHEVEKLSKIPKTQKKPKRDDSGVNTTYVQVRSNRLNRLTAKVSLYTEKAKNEVKCPVCKLWIHGSEESMNNHVALCFQNDESDEPINVEDDEDDNESFEEYEFGDETRIRAISLVPGGYRSLQGQTVKRPRVEEDEDLDVDIDDTIAFGQPQYSELDVILNKNGEDKANDQLRKAVLGDTSIQPLVLETRKWATNEDISEQDNTNENSCESPAALTEDKNDDKQPNEKKNTEHGLIISSLKEKIKDLGDQGKNVKCLICMEPYTKPVVSTTCWHVYCEECWLMTMGVKKLCPQCNMIVFPTDLRKIYL